MEEVSILIPLPSSN